MKSVSSDKVHIEVPNPMVSKVVAITSTSGKREHIEVEVLHLWRLAICFGIYISETNFIFVKNNVGLDNGSIVGLLLSTSFHVVRKEYQWLVIVVCILGLWFTYLVLQRRLQDRFRRRLLVIWLLSRKSRS
jgi:hypothetical protein